MWGVILDGGRWKDIEKVGCHMQGFHPKRRWKVGLEKKSSNDIIDGSKHSFGFTILLGGMRAREAENDAIGCKVIMKEFIVVFPSIITLKSFDGGIELGFDKIGEV